MTPRPRYLPLLFIILVNALVLPSEVDQIKSYWPIIRHWNDPAAQMTLLLDDVPYESLQTAAQQLAPDVTILLITPGQDIRRREYAIYHRALYLLTPRPVWWLAPAPKDDSWESKWWISKPLTAENVAAAAAEKSADCLLLFDVPALPDYGETVSRLPDAQIIQVGPTNCLADTPTPIVNHPTPFWPIRLLLALLVILAFGFAFLAFVDRLNGRITPLETISLTWILGAGLLSTAMLWLNGLGISLYNQRLILTIVAIALTIWQRRYITRSLTALKFSLSAFNTDKDRWQQITVLLLIAFLLFQLIFIILMAVGRPLFIWDSWVNWASKARAIFLQNGITPTLYADPSREVMLLGYPISIPLLEAWLYGWLGAADDRLVGILFILPHLALGGVIYSVSRRRGLKPYSALLLMAAAVTIGHIVNLSASAFTDLWLPVLLVAAAVYLLEWLENGRTGYLLIAALSAGLLTWFKQEGMILAFILLISLIPTFLLCHGKKSWRRLLFACGLIGLTSLIFGLPWRLFASREAVLVTVFHPLTIDNLLTNLSRLPVIFRLIAKELFLNPRAGFVWPLVPVLLIIRRSQLGRIIKQPAIILLLLPILYLLLMSIPYLFSAFVPYQQHLLSSFFRINAHVLLLPLLWLGFTALESSERA